MKFKSKIILLILICILITIVIILNILAKGVSDTEKIVYELSNLCAKRAKSYMEYPNSFALHNSKIVIKRDLADLTTNDNKLLIVYLSYEEKNSAGIHVLNNESGCTAKGVIPLSSVYIDQVWVDSKRRALTNIDVLKASDAISLLIGWEKLIGTFNYSDDNKEYNEDLYFIHRAPW